MGKYGLLGKNIGYSLSPKIHNDIFKAIKSNDTYDIIDLEEISSSEVLSIMRADFKGINITIPYKQVIIDYIDEISEEAKKIGAVNTVHILNGKTVGYNTDYYGFKYMLEERNIDITGKDIVVMGNGGAAYSIISYLLDSSAKHITILSRDKFEAEKMIFSNIFFKKCRNIIELVNYKDFCDKIKNDRYMLINATPVGMTGYKDEQLVTDKELAKFHICVDLIYSPYNTSLLNNFRKLKGNQAIVFNGIKMLIYQAIYAEEIWRGEKFTRDVIEEIVANLTIR